MWQLIAAVELPSGCRIQRSHWRLADKVTNSLCEDPMGRKDGIEAREWKLGSGYAMLARTATHWLNVTSLGLIVSRTSWQCRFRRVRITLRLMTDAII